MKFEKTDVWGFEHAVRGMRNPLNSWDKSDSDVLYHAFQNFSDDDPMVNRYRVWNDRFGLNFLFGKADLNLAQRLIKGGSEHRKFMRQIMVSVDITAPLYWWKEFDTYKIGTTANSTSTMHKLASTPITMDCFETDDLEWLSNIDSDNNIDGKENDYIYKYDDGDNIISEYIFALEELRKRYLKTKDKRYWKELVRWLPESWLQTRTVTFNYENLRSMYFQRRNHKLSEWHSFVDWLKTLPYSEELITFEKEAKENDKI